MNPNRQVTIGLAIMIAGLVGVAVGGVVPSHGLIVGLILLLFVPLSVSFSGAVVALVGLVRKPEARNRSTLIRRIIGGAALACVGSGFGFGALGILGQLPDYAAGLNGAFLPGGAAFSVFLFAGICLLVGFGSGILVALIWWKTRGRHVPPAAEAEPR